METVDEIGAAARAGGPTPGAGTPASPRAFPPAGFVDRVGAAAMLGVGERTVRDWVRQGRLDYAGALVAGDDGRARRVYDAGALRESRGRMIAAEADHAAGGWLPEGHLDRDETARRLGVNPDTLALWHTRGTLRCGRWVRGPDGKRCKVYPAGDVERVRAERAAAEAARAELPKGFVDADGAAEMFGVTRSAWMIWRREGKVPRGRPWRSPTNARWRIYPVAELRPALEAMRGADRVYREGGAGATYHIPDGWVQLREAAAMLGVDNNTFVRWEREGAITCGRNETGRRIKVYPRAEIERLVAENGRLSPPYPDPDRPGCYRVPLAGHDLMRREAVVDAADLALVEGRQFHLSVGDDADGRGSVATSGADGQTRLHQLVLNVTSGDGVVMHLNDDPLDCRRENLVLRTRSERGAAMRKARTFCGRPPTSRFKGVCWDRAKEKWIAYIKRDGKMRSLGAFGDELAAAEAYDEAARELFGEHARPNFPDGVDARLDREAAEAEAAEVQAADDGGGEEADPGEWRGRAAA